MAEYGYAKRELFVQFLVRIAMEIPTATIAMFSTLKYVNSSNFQIFRERWNAEYLGGMVVPSKSFDGINGNFPIGFLIWKTDQNSQRNFVSEITCEVFDRNAHPIGEKKFFNIDSNQFLSNWVVRPKANNTDVIPLKNAITPATASKDLRGTKSADNAIGTLIIKGPDIQNASTQGIVSSGYGSAGTIFITEENLWQITIIYSVRSLVKATWLNNRDQFLQPTKPLTQEFKDDCLVYMLFNGNNLTASANELEWNGRYWSIVNHFIPYSEQEVNATGRFESDFMIRYMQGIVFSTESQAVLNEGKKLWQAYFANTDVRSVRDELKLNRPDVGWYQIRKALQIRNASGDFPVVSFTPFEDAYKNLTLKLQPEVYNLGFLRR